MSGKSLEIVVDGNAGRRPGMESSESALMQRNLVIELDQLHQHAGYQEHYVTGIRQFILFGKQFNPRPR